MVAESSKINARAVVGYAVRAGKMKRLPCEVCGDPKSEAHHQDYSEPLDVQWLCKRDHTKVHFPHLPEVPLKVVAIRVSISVKDEIRELAMFAGVGLGMLAGLLIQEAFQERMFSSRQVKA